MKDGLVLKTNHGSDLAEVRARAVVICDSTDRHLGAVYGLGEPLVLSVNEAVNTNDEVYTLDKRNLYVILENTVHSLGILGISDILS